MENIRIGIIKPGHDLSHIKDMNVDNSTFGGMYEIKGLYDDLIDLGYEVRLCNKSMIGNYDCNLIFIFGSECYTAQMFTIKDFKGIKVQCITDMNLMFNSYQIGEHFILNQVPLSPNYHPFHKYIVRYKWNGKETTLEDWKNKEYTFIYAGGSRNSGRDYYYKKYLIDNIKLDKIYTSSQLDFPNKCEKIPMNELFNEYKKTQFGLVVADELYNSFGFVTQRPYEYMINGMICLYDENYYKDRRSDFYCENKEDLNSKIDMIIENEELVEAELKHNHRLLVKCENTLEYFKLDLHSKIKRWLK